MRHSRRINAANTRQGAGVGVIDAPFESGAGQSSIGGTVRVCGVRAVNRAGKCPLGSALLSV